MLNDHFRDFFLVLQGKMWHSNLYVAATAPFHTSPCLSLNQHVISPYITYAVKRIVM